MTATLLTIPELMERAGKEAQREAAIKGKAAKEKIPQKKLKPLAEKLMRLAELLQAASEVVAEMEAILVEQVKSGKR